ncbi:MAG: CRISPR-associated endonuclease Cas2 [Rhodobacteraceae bacterium]|nr:MAG: CRISPR-associated endonuclease Cas2 [Paracoccaceae bacterium]
MSNYDLKFLSGYRLLWILVMFDLPTDRKPQRKAATKFREYLLDEGFERSQYSVYARFCNGKEAFDTRVRRIEKNLPGYGDVQILQFTDKQYENIIRFYDQGRQKQKKNPNQLVLF